MKYYAVLVNPVDLTKKGALEAKSLTKDFNPEQCFLFSEKDDVLRAVHDGVKSSDKRQFPIYEIETEGTIGLTYTRYIFCKGTDSIPCFSLNTKKQPFKLLTASFEHFHEKDLGIKLANKKISLQPLKKASKSQDSSESLSADSKTSSEDSSNDSGTKASSKSSSHDSDSSDNHKKNKRKKYQGYFTTTTATVLGIAVVSASFFTLGGVPVAAAALAKAGLVLPATVGYVQLGISLAAGVLAATFAHAANALYQYFSAPRVTEKMDYKAQVDAKKDEIKELFEVIKDKTFQKKLEAMLDIKHGVKVKFNKDGAHAKKQPEGNELSQLLDYEIKAITPLVDLAGKKRKKAEEQVLDKAEQAVDDKKKFSAKKKFAA